MKTITRKVLRGLGQIPCSTIYAPGDAGYNGSFGDCVPGDSGGGGYLPDPGISPDPGSSWWNWDAFIKALQIGGQTAVQVVQAENGYYRTPYGQYNYGSGPYSGMTPQMAQQAALSYRGSGTIGISTTTLVMIAVAGIALVMLMKR